MKIITKSTYINCKLEELFDFHMNVKNIKKITPANIKVELLDFDKRKYDFDLCDQKLGQDLKKMSVAAGTTKPIHVGETKYAKFQ